MARATPQPFDPDFPRYHQEEGFPAYRHVPGENLEIQGRFGHSEESITDLPRPESWRDNTDYLFGVDLFNYAFWYEAHAVWNPVWHRAEGDYRLFVNGLAIIADAMLLHHMRDLRGLRDQFVLGAGKLTAVLNQEGDLYMGVNIRHFLRTTDNFFAPFFEEHVSEEAYLQPVDFPLLRLAL